MTAAVPPAPPAPGPGRDGLVRVGVVLAVPEPLCARLTRWRRAFRDPLADVVPPHVTLLPPLAVARTALPGVVEHLRRISRTEPGFGVTLRGVGSFRPVSPVVYAALDRGAGECSHLAERIRSGPLETTLAFPYHPHVTVAQSVAETVLDEAEDSLRDLRARFRVRSVDLYLTATPGDGGWAPWRRFALVEDPDAVVLGAGPVSRGAGSRSRRRPRARGGPGPLTGPAAA